MGCGEGKNLSLKGFHFPAVKFFQTFAIDLYRSKKDKRKDIKLKIVEKPWGRELWIAHTDKYALKIIENRREEQ